MTDLHYLSLAEASRLIRWKDLTSTELTQALLDRIEARDDRAFVTLAKDQALAEMAQEAAAADTPKGAGLAQPAEPAALTQV